MREINPYAHIPFLRRKLKALIPNGSLADRMQRTIGGEIDGIFTVNDFDETSSMMLFPVQSLFDWIVKSGGITLADLEWLPYELCDDQFRDIEEAEYDVIPGSQQMAAFGLWFLNVELDAVGPSKAEDYDENGISPHGFTKAEILNHKAECLLNAYQALSYAERLNRPIELSTDEKEHSAKIDFAALGKDGAKKRHAPMQALRAWALDRYREGSWPSANQAAHELMAAVIEYGRTINAPLSPSNAQRTIAHWINRASV